MERGECIGPYRILRSLGAGGMGEVCLATDLDSCRHVALKLLSPEQAQNPKMRRAFRKEAALGEALSHPNLVAFLGARLEGDQPWLAFEYVVGVSLRDWLRKSGALPPPTATGIMLDVALGLAAAHQKGVLHRDIKPDNVLVTPAGTVKLIDFGAAQLDPQPEQECGQGLVTAPGEARSFAGTWVYASPEQLQGKELDETSDLYSLAVVFFELLTGSLLLEPGAPGAIMLQHSRLEDRLDRTFGDRPELPPALCDCIRSCLRFQASRRRYASALDFAEALQGIMDRAGWERKGAEVQRRLARRELAETDYWRAQNLLATGHVEEGLLRFQALLDLPPAVGRPYRLRIREELHALLRRFHELRRDLPPAERRREGLTPLKQLALMAKKLDDADLLLLVERRFATVLAGLDDPAEGLRLGLRFLSLVPGSIMVASLCLTLARRTKNLAAERSLRLPLARICLERSAFRRALVLALQAFRDRSSHAEGASLLQRCLAERKNHEASQKAFERVLDVVSISGDLGAICNACRKQLRDYPDDRLTWERLGRNQMAIGQGAEAAESLFRSARLTFAGHDLSGARRLFGEVLRLDPDHEGALTFLVEILHAQGLLPGNLDSPRKIRLAVLCCEGLEEPALLSLRKEISGTLGDLPWLRALVPLARRHGRFRFLQELLLQLGRIHLDGERWGEARAAFDEALEGGSAPLELLDELQHLRRIRKVYAPLELLRLRTKLDDGRARDGSSTFTDPARRDTLAGEKRRRAASQPMASESLMK